MTVATHTSPTRMRGQAMAEFVVMVAGGVLLLFVLVPVVTNQLYSQAIYLGCIRDIRNAKAGKWKLCHQANLKSVVTKKLS